MNKAWLLKWEGREDEVQEYILGLLPASLGVDKVAEYIQTINILVTSSLDSLLYYATEGTPDDPIPSKPLVEESAQKYFRVVCGENPYLTACIARNIQVSTNSETGRETIKWEERLADSDDWENYTYTRKQTGTLNIIL